MKRMLVACALVACREQRAQPPLPPPVAATASVSVSAPVTPRFVRHDGVAVTLADGALMRESAPYLEPDGETRPVTVILHAYCADERWMCDWLQYGPLAPQWQVCPRAPTECGNGGAQWTGPGILALVERAVAKTHERHGARVGDAIVLAGMSQGAYAVARMIRELAAQKEPTLKVRGVVLHGAKVAISAADVKKLGIRVVLAAGDSDGAAPDMRRLAQSLKAQGVEAKYASFGDVGHFLPPDSAITMAALIAWARGEN